MDAKKRQEYSDTALNVRRHIAKTIIKKGEGHMGSAMSCADIISVLYKGIMNIGPDNIESQNRDIFILSAGHKCLALYGILVEMGIVDIKVLDTYNDLNSPLPGHPDKFKLKGVEFSTGSLGHGLSITCGMAIASKMKKIDNKLFCLMGDGEQGEGSNWEAAGFAAQHNLDNLTAIIDENGLQINGTTKQVLYPGDLAERYKAFGWSVKKINGHNIDEIYDALSDTPFEIGKPSMIVAKTIKGKGLSFAENDKAYHHWHPDEKEASAAIEQLQLEGVALHE